MKNEGFTITRKKIEEYKILIDNLVEKSQETFNILEELKINLDEIEITKLNLETYNFYFCILYEETMQVLEKLTKVYYQ